MYYFNQDVIKTLQSENIQVTQQEIQTYINLIHEAEKNNRSLKTKKNALDNRRFSLWHAPASAFNDGVGRHYLVLPAPKNWQTKDTEDNTVTTKIFVDLLSGEKKVVKIRRPETLKQTFHLQESSHEAMNNQLLNISVDHQVRFSEGTGTKAYLFQPYRGKLNCDDILWDKTTSAEQLMNLLLASGNLLTQLHSKGYIHADFKPHNVVFSDDKRQLHLIDLESMISIADGQKGIRKMTGSPVFSNPLWVQNTQQNLQQGRLAYYSPANDVYSFLVMAEAFLNQAQMRENRAPFKKPLLDGLSQISAWKRLPLQNIPPLSVIMGRLKMAAQPQISPIYYPQPAVPMQVFHRSTAPIQFFSKPVVPVMCFPRVVVPQQAMPLRIQPIQRVFKF